jgi:Undecaprenyl-phosphate galactose phosphotransferase WbaP
VINPTTSFGSASTDRSKFHAGIRRVDRGPALPGPPIEEIVANHTAIKPSRALCAAYALESAVTGLPLLVTDLLITGGGLILASYLVNLSQGHGMNSGIWLQLPVLLMLQTLMMSVHQLYPGAGVSPVAELRGIVRSTFFALLCLAVMNLMLGQLPRIEFVTFACAALWVSLTLPLARWASRDLLARTRWWGIRILLIGRREDCIATCRLLSHRRSTGFVPAGYTCENSSTNRYSLADQRLLGANDDAAAVGRKHLAPVAGLVSSDDRSAGMDRLILQFPAVVWIDFAKAARNDLDLSRLPQVFTTRVNMPFLRFAPRFVKRFTDLAICIPTMILLCIPALLITCIIKLVSPGPALFGHWRIGQHGTSFRAWKFRTMVPNADEVLQRHLRENPAAQSEWDRNQKLKHDPRVIGIVGEFLRKWSLDEMPQLWNVLIGEMSLVGPRPIVYSEIARYSRGYLAYSHMMPGITGLWQISGRNNTSYATRVTMDEHYARNWSLWMDFWVLLKTPLVVITRDGAY